MTELLRAIIHVRHAFQAEETGPRTICHPRPQPEQPLAASGVAGAPAPAALTLPTPVGAEQSATVSSAVVGRPVQPSDAIQPAAAVPTYQHCSAGVSEVSR